MVNLFLDTNILMDFMEKRDPDIRETLKNFPLYISVTSVGHWLYVFKRKVPTNKSFHLLGFFNMVSTDALLVDKAMQGPTSDYEDNLQLHSAVDAECDLFLTKDKGLLKLGYFGKVKIISEFPVDKLQAK